MTSKINRVVAFTLILALGPMVANATPEYWSVNGHHYEVIADPDIDWATANTLAQTKSHLGKQGHLATVTSQPENDFVDSIRQPLFGDQETSPGVYDPLAKAEAWIGGSQPAGSGNNDDWTWVNAEGSIPAPGMHVSPYANWKSGEPNNVGSGEHELTLGRYLDGTWNDSNTGNGNIRGYIIEYDTVDPVANDDPGNTANSGETININVLANDVLNGHDVTSIDITAPSTNGGMAVVVGTAPNFSVDYTSAPGFGQEDSFGYTINSGQVVSNEATVTILVDGSVSETPPGEEIVVFGGPENGVPLLATGEFAVDGGESTIRCCTIRDPRVKLKTRRNGSKKIIHKGYPFDIGKAMGTSLADADCADLPQPNNWDLIVPRHFSVHTATAGSLDPDDYRFGLCVVETEVEWLGAINLDIDAAPAVGYSVDCTRTGVENQPLTLGLTTDPPEFNAPLMRAVTTECDPRGAPKWSTWYFIPNAVHLTKKLPSKAYVIWRFVVLKLMILSMQFDPGNPVDNALLNSVRSKVDAARNIVLGPAAPDLALPILDDATEEVLIPPVAPFPGSPYPGSSNFPNPKGELTSHLMALRYAICNELAFVDMPLACKIDPDVDALLPDLPTP